MSLETGFSSNNTQSRTPFYHHPFALAPYQSPTRVAIKGGHGGKDVL
jgi:hypothetical protein